MKDHLKDKVHPSPFVEDIYDSAENGAKIKHHIVL